MASKSSFILSKSPDQIHYILDKRLSKSNSILSNSEIQELNFEDDRLIDSTQNENKCQPPPLYIIGLISCFIGFAGLFSGLYFGLKFNKATVATTIAPYVPTTLPITQQLSIGQGCLYSSQCITSSYCDSVTYVCSCSPGLYYEATTGTCNQLKSYGQSCTSSTQCNFNQLLLCSSSICQCDSMLFWNPNTYMCEDKRGLGETCIGATNECYSSNMTCTSVDGSLYNRCVCDLPDYYFSFALGDCALRKVSGTYCYAHFECVDFAWCTQWPGDTLNRCTCK